MFFAIASIISLLIFFSFLLEFICSACESVSATKGGKRRAAKLSPEERSASAKKAALAR
jgi:hypothetical protein